MNDLIISIIDQCTVTMREAAGFDTGQLLAARIILHSALSTLDRQISAVRLGDIDDVDALSAALDAANVQVATLKAQLRQVEDVGRNVDAAFDLAYQAGYAAGALHGPDDDSCWYVRGARLAIAERARLDADVRINDLLEQNAQLEQAITCAPIAPAHLKPIAHRNDDKPQRTAKPKAAFRFRGSNAEMEAAVVTALAGVATDLGHTPTRGEWDDRCTGLGLPTVDGIEKRLEVKWLHLILEAGLSPRVGGPLPKAATETQ